MMYIYFSMTVGAKNVEQVRILGEDRLSVLSVRMANTSQIKMICA